MNRYYLVEWKGLLESGKPYFDSRTFRYYEEEEVNIFVYYLEQRESITKVWVTIRG